MPVFQAPVSQIYFLMNYSQQHELLTGGMSGEYLSVISRGLPTMVVCVNTYLLLSFFVLSVWYNLFSYTELKVILNKKN